MLGLMLLSVALGAEYPAGAEISPAVALQLNEDGLSSLSQVLPGIVPDEPITVANTSDAQGWGCFGYEYGLSNIWVGLEVVGTTITPRSGYLDVELDLSVWVNDETDKFTIDYEALCLGESCPGYVDPFPVQVALPFTLNVVKPSPPELPYFEAEMGSINVVNGLASADIQLDCAIGTIEDVLNVFGLSLFDLIIGLMESVIQDQVAGMQDSLEATIADALSAASIDQQIELADAVIDVTVVPDDVAISPDGMEIAMLGVSNADQAACVAALDSGGSLKTDGPLPALSDIPADSQLAVQVSDDFVNQLLYSVWRGGVLCFEADEEAIDGLPLDSSLLGLIGGDAFTDILPAETHPLVLRTEPASPPRVSMAGTDDVNIQVDDLYASFYTTLDHRVARVLRMDLDVDAGANLALDTVTGTLGVNVDLGAESIEASVGDDVLVVGYEAEIEAGFAGIVSTVVEPLVGDLVGDSLTFALPVFGTTGLTALTVETTGPDGDWLAVNAALGEVTYEGAGCDDESDAGCAESSCSAAGGGGVGWLVAMLGVLLRRRTRTIT